MTKEYFKKRDNTFYTKYTKQQIRKMVNIHNPNTFIPLLKEMDYLYLEELWSELVNYYNNDTIFGRYVATMRLLSYKSFSFADSEYFNTITRKEEVEHDFNP